MKLTVSIDKPIVDNLYNGFVQINVLRVLDLIIPIIAYQSVLLLRVTLREDVHCYLNPFLGTLTLDLCGNRGLFKYYFSRFENYGIHITNIQLVNGYGFGGIAQTGNFKCSARSLDTCRYLKKSRRRSK